METVAKNANNGIVKEVSKGAIKLDKIDTNQYQKPGTKTAQIRQEVKTVTKYPSRRVDSNMQDNIFDGADFGFKPQEFPSIESRVAWIPVPENIAPEVVQSKLDEAYKNGGCIYRVLASVPVLDDNQKYAITQGLKTMDDFADAQALRYPENDETKLNGTANKLILDKSGNVQYRKTYFSKTAQEDVDARGQSVPYLSANLQAELAGASVMAGQTI